MGPKLPEKFTICSPDGQYCAHIDSVYCISRPPLSKNPSSAPVYSSACTRYESQVMWSSRLSVSNVSVILLVQLRPSLTRGTHKLTILHTSKSIAWKKKLKILCNANDQLNFTTFIQMCIEKVWKSRCFEGTPCYSVHLTTEEEGAPSKRLDFNTFSTHIWINFVKLNSTS